MRSLVRKDVAPSVKRLDYPIRRFESFDALSEESYLPLSWCRYGYNVTLKHGVITGGIGISEARIEGRSIPNAVTVGSRIEKAVIFRGNGAGEEIIVALMQNGKLYTARFNDETFTYADVDFTTHNVTFLDYHYGNADCLIITCDDGQSYIFDGTTFTQILHAPRMNSACIHNGRVYGTVSRGVNRLYFSDDLDPTNWNVSLTEGGYIDFPDEGGKVTGVTSFKGNLYIFREFAIHKLSAYIDQTDYVMTKVLNGASRIYFKGSAVCSDAMIILTDDGFLRYDGYGFSRVFRGVDPLISGRSHAVSCYFNDKYYLSCSIKRDNVIVGDEIVDTNVNNGILIYDFADESFGIFRGTDVGYFMPVNLSGTYELFVLFGSMYRGLSIGVVDDSGKLFGTSLHKLWRSPYTDFADVNQDKVLKRLFITTDSPVALKIKMGRTASYSIVGSDYSQVIPVNMRSQKIGLEISTDESAFYVRNMYLELDYINRARKNTEGV